MINVTHWDPDGVFCTYLLMKKFGDKIRVYYASPSTIVNELLKIIKDNSKEENLYITDIAINQEAIYVSSYFKNVYIIDHHKIENLELTSRVSLYVKEYRSASRVLAEFLNVDSKYLDMIDNIDSNNITNDLERDFRDVFSAIRFIYKKDFQMHFTNIARTLYIKEDVKIIVESYKNVLKQFRSEINQIEKDLDKRARLELIKNKKILFLELDKSIPSMYFLDRIRDLYGDVDYVIFFYEQSKRGEIRTLNNSNILQLAKFLGGGGHEYAAGFRYEDKNLAMERIRAFMNKI